MEIGELTCRDDDVAAGLVALVAIGVCDWEVEVAEVAVVTGFAYIDNMAAAWAALAVALACNLEVAVEEEEVVVVVSGMACGDNVAVALAAVAALTIRAFAEAVVVVEEEAQGVVPNEIDFFLVLGASDNRAQDLVEGNCILMNDWVEVAGEGEDWNLVRSDRRAPVDDSHLICSE